MGVAFNLHTVHRAARCFERFDDPRATLKRLLALHLGDKRHWRVYETCSFFMDVQVEQDPEVFLTGLLAREEGAGAFRAIVEALLRAFDPEGTFRGEYEDLTGRGDGSDAPWDTTESRGS